MKQSPEPLDLTSQQIYAEQQRPKCGLLRSISPVRVYLLGISHTFGPIRPQIAFCDAVSTAGIELGLHSCPWEDNW